MVSVDATAGEGQRLRGKIALVAPVLRAAGRRFSTHPGLRALYPEYLSASHCVVRASVPLMEAALRQAEALDDLPARRLVPYLRHHIVEEQGHDEWLLEDLESVGVARASVVSRVPPPAVATLVGAQYYWLLHYHPVALLGYMAVLEGNPPSPEQVHSMTERTGFPARAFRTLLEHAQLDPGHGEEVFGLLDELHLTEQLSGVLGVSAMHTVVSLAAVIDGIVDGGAGDTGSAPPPS